MNRQPTEVDEPALGHYLDRGDPFRAVAGHRTHQPCGDGPVILARGLAG